MTPVMDQLTSLSLSERRAAVEGLVVEQFKAILLMADDEDLPTTDSFFELGLTSLGMTDVKQRLEDLLDVGIDSTMMFNCPTIEQFVDQLLDQVLADKLGGEQ